MCAIVAGDVWCWGRTQDGQCGVLAESNIVTPRNVTSGIAARGTFTGVMGGRQHSCALTTNGAVYCWGRNVEGQIGNGAASSTPVTTPSLAVAANAQELAIGDLHSCARMADGTVSCWGDNRNLQLGVSGHVHVATPTRVAGIAAVTAIAAGALHSCVISAGVVRCWGENYSGQLGNGATGAATSRPQDVDGVNAAVEIEGGYVTTCARLEDGGVRCWGTNERGALGCVALAGQPCEVTAR
jgi:alpha-tubulin suppressor-like RCC1 family protein